VNGAEPEPGPLEGVSIPGDMPEGGECYRPSSHLFGPSRIPRRRGAPLTAADRVDRQPLEMTDLVNDFHAGRAAAGVSVTGTTVLSARWSSCSEFKKGPIPTVS
jgi:hypothetical protein